MPLAAPFLFLLLLRLVQVVNALKYLVSAWRYPGNGVDVGQVLRGDPGMWLSFSGPISSLVIGAAVSVVDLSSGQVFPPCTPGLALFEMNPSRRKQEALLPQGAGWRAKEVLE